MGEESTRWQRLATLKGLTCTVKCANPKKWNTPAHLELIDGLLTRTIRVYFPLRDVKLTSTDCFRSVMSRSL